MSTFGIMQAAIADEMANDGALTTAQIQNAIKRAIRDYEGRPWWFNQKVATFNTVANQEYYGTSDLADIPDIVRIDSAMITYGGYKNPLAAVNFLDLDQEQNASRIALPNSYTIYKNQIRLFPIPDAVYTVTLSYIYKFAELSADADTNAWMTDGEELIRQAAKKRIAWDYLQADDLAARFAKMEDDAYDSIREEDRNRRPQKFLTAPAMLAPRTFNILTGY